MKTQPRRAPIGAAWCILHSGASWCLQKGCVRFAPFLFPSFVWANNHKKNKMEPTIKEVLAKFNSRLDFQDETIDKKFKALRRDYETEITKLQKQVANIREAVGILTHENAVNTGSKLSQKAFKQIMGLLEAKI